MGTWVSITVIVGVGVPDCSAGGVGVSSVPGGVNVGVPVAVWKRVKVGVDVGVQVAVWVGVVVCVGVEVLVSEWIGVMVGVNVGVLVAVWMGVNVGVFVGGGVPPLVITTSEARSWRMRRVEGRSLSAPRVQPC